jgi:hypothetical protein
MVHRLLLIRARAWALVSRLSTRFRRPPSVAAIIALIWIVYAGVNMHRHGVSSDEPALFYAGDRTFFWLTHPHTPNALAFGDREPDPPGFSSAFQRFPDWNDPAHYPVLTGVLMAVTTEIFHKRLHWLGATDGHHLALVLLHALGLYLTCRLATRLFGRAAAIAGTVALALYPSAVGHAFNNPKDWPCALFAGAAALAAAIGFVENKGRALVWAGLLLGLALSCKLNAAITLIAILTSTPIAYFLLYFHRRAISRGLTGGFLAMPYMTVGVFLIAWPWLYQGKNMATYWRHLSDYMIFMLDYGAGERTVWSAYPLKAIIYMSPPLVLVCAALGVALAWRQGRNHVTAVVVLLLVMWIPVLRIAAPKTNFYDANRHYIEYIPPLCMLAGVGAVGAVRWLLELLRRWRPRLARFMPWATGGAAAIAMVFLLWPIVEYRPHETAYFNMFIGGLGGAQRRALFKTEAPHDSRANGTEGDYWWSSEREAVRLARETDPSAPIALCGGASQLIPSTIQPAPRFVGTDDPKALVYVCVRELFCSFSTVRQLESKRPIIRRVERGGGLVWELLGPETGAHYTVLTPESAYSRTQ